MEIITGLAPYGVGFFIACGAVIAAYIHRGSTKKEEVRNRTMNRLEASLQAIIDLKKWSLENYSEVNSFALDFGPTDLKIQPKNPLDRVNLTPKLEDDLFSAIQLNGESSYDTLLNQIASYFPQQIEHAENQLGTRFNRFKNRATNVLSRCKPNIEVNELDVALKELDESYFQLNDICNNTTKEIREEIRRVHLS